MLITPKRSRRHRNEIIHPRRIDDPPHLHPINATKPARQTRIKRKHHQRLGLVGNKPLPLQNRRKPTRRIMTVELPLELHPSSTRIRGLLAHDRHSNIKINEVPSQHDVIKPGRPQNTPNALKSNPSRSGGIPPHRQIVQSENSPRIHLNVVYDKPTASPTW